MYKRQALDCCTDGYSTRYQSACKGRTLQTVELVNLCRESETRRETLPLPEATGEVVALWARVEGCTAAPEAVSYTHLALPSSGRSACAITAA